MKKILIFLPDSRKGGPYVSHLRIMNSCLKREFEFIPVYYPRIRKMICRAFRNKLKKIIMETNPDIIHCVGLQIDGYLQVRLVRSIKKNARILLAVHGSLTEVKDRPWFFRVVTDFLERKQLELCDKYYGVSKYALSMKILSDYRSKSLGVVYNLPDVYSNSFDRKLVREKLQINQNDIVIVSTGRITKDKGFDELANIIEKINNKKYCFLILGDGDYMNEMQSVVKQSAANTRFVGYVSNVYPYLASGDIFIICTKHETLCTAIVEAGSSSLPVIAPNVGGIPEIIDNGISGYLYESGNIESAISCLKGLADDTEKRFLFGNTLNKKINDVFSEKKITNALRIIYHEMLSI